MTDTKYHVETCTPGDFFDVDGHIWACEKHPKHAEYPGSYPELHWVSPSCMFTVSVSQAWQSQPYQTSNSRMTSKSREEAARAAMKYHQQELKRASDLVRKWGHVD